VSGTASAPEAHATLTAADEPRLAPATYEPWRDRARPVEERVSELVERMTLEEKVGQLYSVWVGVPMDGEKVAPHQHELADTTVDWSNLIKAGLGQLTRPFGSAPVSPSLGVDALARMQTEIVAANRFGIPAIAHEECLTGFMTLGATVYPTPLAWGATFDAGLVERMATQIGTSMSRVGVHQGLAPVLDVIRDPRWGRTEETIGEDPYLVGTVGTAYVRGLQSAGIIATLKHFVGYSGSKAGRNFGPVAVGPRELSDIFLIPFEMAIREGGASSVMHSYAEIDGVPVAADAELLTTLLRETWGFDGTVVADYFGVSFLEILHHIAASPAEAAALALTAGVDVELPAVRCYREPLVTAVRDGAVPESLVDRAVRRVLRQKCEMGLLDADWEAVPRAVAGVPDGAIDLDPPSARRLARQVAEESVVLLANNGVLPLRPGARIALVGPQADDPDAMLGCYTFPRHVSPRHPNHSGGVEIPSLFKAIAEQFTDVWYAQGCTVDGADTSGIPAAVEAARGSEVCVIVLGDRAGLFGVGTSGEGCDAADLALPGVQGQLLEAVLQTGTPVVLVMLAGRPYALGDYADRLAAIVQGFFPGEEGGPAVTAVLTGQVCPSGRLPVSVPYGSGAQPSTYLAPTLGHRSEVSSIDPTPLFPFGHGLSYTQFSWEDVQADATTVSTDGSLKLGLTVRNTGGHTGAEVVQLYLHDPVAQVTRPIIRLIGYAKVRLDPGESQRVTFEVPADLAAFTGREGQRVVEPGEIELRLAASSADVRHAVRVQLVGAERVVDHRRRLTSITQLG
jgi:beta-xylosidase